MEDLVIEEEGASSALKITLGDFLVFINWMNQTEKSLERGEALPTTPELDSGKIKGWIQLVQRLDTVLRELEPNFILPDLLPEPLSDHDLQIRFIINNKN